MSLCTTPGQGKPQVSAIICTRNRGGRIVPAVLSILRNTHPHFELIIIDQSSNDDTEKALESLREDHRLRYLRSATKGLGLARSIGLDLVQNDIVLMTDDDCEVDANWIALMAEAHEQHPQAAIVFCEVLPGPHDRAQGFIPVALATEEALIKNLRQWCRAGASNAGIGAGLGIRRSLVQRIGGFDRMLGAGTPFHCAEETDLALRAILNGYYIYRTRATSVVHHGFRTFEEGRWLVRGYMFGVAAMYAKLLRCGHYQVIMVLCYDFWRTILRPTLSDLRHRRKPPVLGRLSSILKGLATGWRTPLDQGSATFCGKKTADLLRKYNESSSR